MEIKSNSIVCDQLILDSYKPADTEEVYHVDDPDLPIIKVPLPECPPIEMIEGYGKRPQDQKWKRQKFPETLDRLQRRELRDGSGTRPISITEIWNELSKNPKKWIDEIKWIDQEIYRTIYGHWLFINGKPTYIPGWHYEYATYWKIDIGYPDYRDRDRRFFTFCRFAYNDPFCYGVNYPKHRREGATNKAQCINWSIISKIKNAHGGIQSMTEQHAEKVFQTFLVGSWKTLPFFLKPEYEGSTEPKSILRLNPPGSSVTGKSGAAAVAKEGLGSSIDFKESGIKAYDTYKLYFYHGDEVGKTARLDVYKRHEVIKPCLAQGPDIHGFELNTSTVGDMDKSGGRNFFNMCKLSQYDKRNANGQTPSGLYTLFMPAYEGFDGFIDEFGASVMDEPTKTQAEYLKKMWDRKMNKAKLKEEAIEFNPKIGAKKFIQNQINGFLENDDTDSALEYMRQHPTRYRHCWRSKPNASGFDIKIIEDRLEDLLFEEKKVCVRGDLEWEDGIPATPADPKKRRVVFRENDENGKFIFSMRPPDHETNKCYYDPHFEGIGSWIPTNTKKFVAGGDPFKFSKTHHNRKSNGGGAVKYRRDYIRDPEQKPKNEWVSSRFVCTYSNRVEDKEIYAEDMLMMCIYWGCQMFPEIDVPLLWDYFEKRGYLGFLMYRIDKSTGHLRKTPGSTSTGNLKQELFGCLMTYIKNHGTRECHREFLEQCRDIETIDQMKDFDLFTACGYAEYGDTQIFEQANEIGDNTNGVDLMDYYRVSR